MTDLRDKLARPLIPILREASDLSVEEATVAASTLVNAQIPVVEEAIRQAVARFDEKMSVKLAKSSPRRTKKNRETSLNGNRRSEFSGLKVLLESSTQLDLGSAGIRRKIGKCQSTAFPRHQCLAEQRRAIVAFARTAKAK
jgi:hypothetical protein